MKPVFGRRSALFRVRFRPGSRGEFDGRELDARKSAGRLLAQAPVVGVGRAEVEVGKISERKFMPTHRFLLSIDYHPELSVVIAFTLEPSAYGLPVVR